MREVEIGKGGTGMWDRVREDYGDGEKEEGDRRRGGEGRLGVLMGECGKRGRGREWRSKGEEGKMGKAKRG